MLEIECSCGRRMQPLPRSKGFRCGCGRHLNAVHQWVTPEELAGARSQYCQVVVEGRTCNNPLIPGRLGWSKHGRREYAAAGMVCEDCALKILNEAIEHPATREYILRTLGRMEVLKARWEYAAEDFKQQREQQEKKRADAEAAMVHVVYYVRLGMNHIKIGTTGRLEQRMVELRVANRENLLATEPGGRDVEHQRHRQFTILRYDSRKEDFAESQRLLTHIEDVRNKWGDPWELPARLIAGDEGSDVESA